jgi:hypothetical protein
MVCTLGASCALVPMEMVNAHATTRTARINFFIDGLLSRGSLGDRITDSAKKFEICSGQAYCGAPDLAGKLQAGEISACKYVFPLLPGCAEHQDAL